MKIPFTLHALWGMSRPLQLLSIVLVYILGTLVATANGTPVDMFTFSSGLVVLMLVSASVHYANEYADYETDIRTTRTPYSGGSGALVAGAGTVSRRRALQAAWVTLASGLIVAAYYWLMGTLNGTAFLILLLGTLGGWMYSLPPLQLAWNGFGEGTNAFLGGMLLPLYGYAVHTNSISLEIISLFIPFMLVDFLNLLATQWPDRHADKQVGKDTLAVQWPEARLRRLYLGVVALALTSLILLTFVSIPVLVTIVSCSAIPFLIWGIRTYTYTEDPSASVNAMVVLLIVQIGAWGWLSL